MSSHPEHLSPIRVAMPPAGIVATLDALAARGKLPEFSPAPKPDLFTLPAFGEPFDYTLSARAQPDGPAETTLTFSLQRRWRLPLIMLILIAFTIWPGVWLTDSLIRTYWSTYDFPTWTWYMPVTVLPLPWMWRRMARKSRDAAQTHAAELRETIRAALATKA